MKKVAVLLSDGFEEIEALTVVDVLRRANIKCDMVSIKEEFVEGSHKIMTKSDKILDSKNFNYDMVVIPGGMPGAKNLKESSEVLKVLKDMNEEKKFIGSICAGPIALNAANVINGVEFTCYPGYEKEIKEGIFKEQSVVVCKNIITSRGPGVALEFSYKLLEVLGYEEEAEKLKEGMLFKN